MNFKAAMFDFDGTVTEKGQFYPAHEVTDALVKLSRRMPIAFCTGRQLESFERHGMAELMREISNEDKPAFLKNLFLFAENGSVGYFWDTDSDDFKEFYRVEWPENFVAREGLMKLLNEAVSEYGEVYYNAHRVVIVMRTKLHGIPDRRVEDVYYLSDKIFEATELVLEELSPNYEEHLHVGNSGIGVIVCPADGDKDRGIREFGRYLSEERGVELSADLREIMVVGDRPLKSGNDFWFLKGAVGTPFTVGDLNESCAFPKAVFDKNTRRLLHSNGTLYLIEGILGK